MSMSEPTDRQEDGEAGGVPAPSVHMVDLAVTAVIVALCAFLFWDTTGFETVPASLAQNVQPTMFPRLLLAVIVLMALFLPFEHVQKKVHGIDLDSARSDWVRPITYVTGLVLLGVVIAIPWLGTFVAMVVACALLPVLWGERRWWLVAVYAIAFPVGITLVFVAGLEVNFEPGIAGHLFR
jgi:putative tricarboxylic transport membrane protein